MTLSGGAFAATFDFATLATGNEKSVEGLSETNGGVTLTFDGIGGLAYYDSVSSGRPAGLGVCGAVNAASQCITASDDNVTAGESVTLVFDQLVNISGLVFRSEGHFLVDQSLNAKQLVSSETLLINGVEFTFGAAQTATFTGLRSINFAFGGSSADEFYLSALTATPVPVPAALPLLLAGLGGLGVMARRKRKAA
jgi:hypothetical protein